ncbi:hypothetical protein [Tumebacillus lipolyticus]|uniref:HEAT repeat domain-containing protein n=1 Tax=Tumebacillus lipolyticus TaxID=1280370 RepID=A0ABW4ZX69_9BACL
MNLNELIKRKDIKPKEKTEALAATILDGELAVLDVIQFANTAKEPLKATCMEAFEYATSNKPEVANSDLFKFATDHLGAKASRLKWESAKVIGNIAHLFAEDLETTIERLLENTQDSGTVVRWSAAYALTQIYSLPKYANDAFRSKLAEICEAEEKASIRKIYLKVL